MRDKTRIVEFNGRRIGLAALMRERQCALNQNTVWKRLQKGWPIARAMSMAPHKSRGRCRALSISTNESFLRGG